MSGTGSRPGSQLPVLAAGDPALPDQLPELQIVGLDAAAIDPLPVIPLSPDQLPELQIAALDAAAVDPLPVIPLSLDQL